jgi:hypothetical protein
MGTQTSFPVFEADQVLTNNHLNDLRRYLDQQNRLTRSKLIGCGIVCGVEITYSSSSIKLSEGCGLTSQGYIITICDKEFTHYIPYIIPGFPDNIDFLESCPGLDKGKIPFYKPAFGEGLFQLITEDQLKKLSAEMFDKAVELSNVSKPELDKLVIVAFLEAEEINLKNCDTNDCNDKGSRLDFEPKVLLVPKAILNNIKRGTSDRNPSNVLPPIALKRYNVPVKNLPTSTEVLMAFASVADPDVIDKIKAALDLCYTNYSYLLETGTENPFGNFDNKLKDLRQSILGNAPVLIQYFYDYLDDIIKAYYEFREKVVCVHSECCGDEFRFPFHLMLGEATVDTQHGRQSAYREYFVYSPLFDSQNEKLNEIRFLFTKMKLLTSRFLPYPSLLFEGRDIKITPSSYGKTYLSERCIPYYYKVKDNANLNEQHLYHYWNYKKAIRGEDDYNLSYNADDYAEAGNLLVREPLKYDIEKYNFFRVEGHIGRQVDKVLGKVIGLKQNYNLPFDVIALSADYIGAILKGEDPQCVIQDLESEYRIIIAEFICKLHDAFCSIYKFNFNPKPVVAMAARAGAPAPVAMALAPSVHAATGTAINTDEDDELNELMSKVDFAGVKITPLNLSHLVSESHLTKTYVKGSSLLKLCGVTKGTIGAAYLSNISGSNFFNPILLNTQVKAAGLYSGFFKLIDSIESMFKILLTNELSELNLDEFRKAYTSYENEVNSLSRSLKVITDKVQIFLSTCIVEILEALKDEYKRRINQQLLAQRFNAYFKMHSGAEHKAGVPKGGTFILVYYEETKQRRIDVNALFVNKALGTIMLSRHPELLEQANGTDEMKAATIDLKNAVNLNCPEQHLQLSDSINNFLKKDNTIPQASREALLMAISRPPEKQKFKLTSGMVIADFYVPYICCSDCAPMAYILPETESVPIPVENAPEKRSLAVCGNLKEFKLEPNLAATDVIKIISNDGLKIKEQTLEALPSSSAHRTTVFHISYKINDKQIDLTITVVLPVTDFNINISSVTEGNQQLINLELESMDKNYTEVEWKITPEPIGLASPLKDDPLKKVRMTVVSVRELKSIHIEHIVTVQTDTGKCSATGVYDLPFLKLKNALIKKSFDNHTTF